MDLSMQWITMIGALTAALAGLYNIWLSYTDRGDSILVKHGTHTPIDTPAVCMYVVNTGKHPVFISDFGFVNEDGTLFSVPYYNETEHYIDGPDIHEFYVGTTTIQPNQLFSAGLSYSSKIIGVYAITSTQSVRRVRMIRNRLWPHVLWKYLRSKFRTRHY